MIRILDRVEGNKGIIAYDLLTTFVTLSILTVLQKQVQQEL